ncbi:MAG TPA: MFS transporter [Xanthobacteraceae bacterium]|nr:MFS transporter [Xanthobacteraceae bacterium]
MSSVDRRLESWRTPAVILACGCLISMIGFGPRSTLGFFLTPMSTAHGWGREVFALSVAIQTLLYGIAQPFSGAIADRFGTVRVIIAGTLLYAAGIFMMAHAATPETLFLSSGVLIGFGLSGCSFNLVISSFGKLLPESWRSLAFGAGTASGSFGQFLFSPLAVGLVDTVGWRTTLEVFAGLLLLIVPLAFAIATPRSDAPAQTSVRSLRKLDSEQTSARSPRKLDPAADAAPSAAQIQNYKQALAEALGHRSYILLVLGFFTCGFQLGFVTLHLPSYLIDRGLSAQVGGWTLGVIGLFNIVGAMLSGWLGGRMPKRYILAVIYFARALAVVFLITLPASPAVALIYGAATGLLWLSSVPPTAGLVAVMFGTRWMAMLFGIAFFSHQVGGFLGVYLGGLLYERTGSYDIVWWLGVLFGVLSALINLPIVEKPVPRPAPAPA